MTVQCIGQRLTTDKALPLVVDLDGTLLRSDLLYESLFSCPPSLHNGVGVVRAILQGKARLKYFLAQTSAIDYSLLPYDDEVLALIEAARLEGRTIFLATASNETHAAGVCSHLGLFDGFIASDPDNNLKGRKKAEALIERFGSGGFEYVGNDASDLHVWSVSAAAVTIRTTAEVKRTLSTLDVPTRTLPSPGPTWADWRRAIRVHQYAKNALLFVALLTSHSYFELDAVLRVCIAFTAFSACASAIYIVNDLVDLQADRAHPSKSSRPFASGKIELARALPAAAVLLTAGLALSFAVSLKFVGVLIVYLLLTTAYSFSLKRKMIIDVIALAALYTIRVIAGAVAAEVVLSEWLLAFSMFVFMGLALIKRATELVVRRNLNLADSSNRNYKLGDEIVVVAMAAASGFNALTVLCLYIASPGVQSHYRFAEFLWLVPPIVLYWYLRALMLAWRGLLTDDPIVFALRDRISRIAVILMVALVIMAGNT
ncbi:MAG: UbiA family prenyltransferase [Burkholderiales bacterium]|nr:UbiA family prenyltransferase [Burkholderiales bacterium]